MQHLDTLGADLAGDGADAGRIAARAVVACDQADLHGVRADGETIGMVEVAAMAARAEPTSPVAPITATLSATSSAALRWQQAVVAFAPAIFDPDILAFDEAFILKALAKRRGVELVEF